MDTINVAKLKRNPDAIKGAIKKVGESYLATKNLKVIFPERYINRKLAIVGSTVKMLSIAAYVDDDGNYTVMNAPIFQELLPYNISTVIINKDEYKQLSFRENDVILINDKLVMSEVFLYDLFDEFFIKGNIPWFMNRVDVAKIFNECGKYAKSNIGNNPLAFEILTSVIARSSTDQRVFFRQTDGSGKPVYVGLNNIYYSLDNTTAKLVGGYFGYGITVALIDKEKDTTTVSQILRA